MIGKIELVAAGVAVVMTVGYGYYDDLAKKNTPASDFFTVRQVSIPDFSEGQNPVIVYDRTVKKDFFGTFVVEIHRAEEGVNYAVCSNSASRTYRLGEKPPETVDLKWFIDRECGLLPGQYVAETTWKIEAEGYPTKEYSAVSNVFKVFPKGAKAYISLDEQEQLVKAQELLDDPIPVLKQLIPELQTGSPPVGATQ